jgi:hypothetical protein
LTNDEQPAGDPRQFIEAVKSWNAGNAKVLC